jgi:hypothetical protein
MHALDLTNPEVVYSIGLVTPRADLAAPIVGALLDEVPAIDVLGLADAVR